MSIGHHHVKNIPVLDIHELIAGKLAALFSRCASRDLYDLYTLLIEPQHAFVLNKEKIRIGFLVYGAMNRTDWRTISVENIDIDLQELRSKLLMVMSHPTYQKDVLKKRAEEWVEKGRAALYRLTRFSEY